MSLESGPVAVRYASALIDMAVESGVSDSVEKDLQDLLAMVRSSDDLRALIANPLATRAQQQAAVQAVADKAKFHELTTRFLGILVQNRRLVHADAIIKAALRELAVRRGEVEARVQVAYPLTAAQETKLREELGQALGKAITLNIEIDESLLGGMIVTYGSRMIDDSVKRKLERLRRAMNTNENTTDTLHKEVG